MSVDPSDSLDSGLEADVISSGEELSPGTSNDNGKEDVVRMPDALRISEFNDRIPTGQTWDYEDYCDEIQGVFEDYRCPICLDVLINTVKVDCNQGHEFCNLCIEWWTKYNGNQLTGIKCPVCRCVIFTKTRNPKTDVEIYKIFNALPDKARESRLAVVAKWMERENEQFQDSRRMVYPVYPDTSKQTTRLPQALNPSQMAASSQLWRHRYFDRRGRADRWNQPWNYNSVQAFYNRLFPPTVGPDYVIHPDSYQTSRYVPSSEELTSPQQQCGNKSSEAGSDNSFIEHAKDPQQQEDQMEWIGAPNKAEPTVEDQNGASLLLHRSTEPSIAKLTVDQNKVEYQSFHCSKGEDMKNHWGQGLYLLPGETIWSWTGNSTNEEENGEKVNATEADSNEKIDFE